MTIVKLKCASKSQMVKKKRLCCFPLLFPLRYDVDSKSPDLSKHVSAQTVTMNRRSVKAVPQKNSEL